MDEYFTHHHYANYAICISTVNKFYFYHNERCRRLPCISCIIIVIFLIDQEYNINSSIDLYLNIEGIRIFCFRSNIIFILCLCHTKIRWTPIRFFSSYSLFFAYFLDRNYTICFCVDIFILFYIWLLSLLLLEVFFSKKKDRERDRESNFKCKYDWTLFRINSFFITTIAS